MNKRRFGFFDSCMRQCGLHVHLSRALWNSGHIKLALIDLRLAKIWRRAARKAAIMDAAKAKARR